MPTGRSAATARKIGKLIAVLDLLLEPGGAAIFFKTLGVDKELEDAQKRMQKRNFQATVKKTSTPLDKSPLALVILRKS